MRALGRLVATSIDTKKRVLTPLEDFGGGEFAAITAFRLRPGQNQGVLVGHLRADQPGARMPDLLVVL